MHTELLRLNPNMILLIGLDFQNGLFGRYGEDWEGWLRDKDGNRLTSVWRTYTGEEAMDNLIDFTKPVVIEKLWQQAKAISECGLYDGIWLDHWGEGKRLQGIYTAEEEYIAKTQSSDASAKLFLMTFLYSLTTTAVNCSPAGHPMSTYLHGIRT